MFDILKKLVPKALQNHRGWAVMDHMIAISVTGVMLGGTVAAGSKAMNMAGIDQQQQQLQQIENRLIPGLRDPGWQILGAEGDPLPKRFSFFFQKRTVHQTPEQVSNGTMTVHNYYKGNVEVFTSAAANGGATSGGYIVLTEIPEDACTSLGVMPWPTHIGSLATPLVTKENVNELCHGSNRMYFYIYPNHTAASSGD